MSKRISPRAALKKAVVLCGGQSELARRIGGSVKQQHVHYWIHNGLTAEHVIAVESAVLGKVTRHELRPDIYPVEART